AGITRAGVVAAHEVGASAVFTGRVVAAVFDLLIAGVAHEACVAGAGVPVGGVLTASVCAGIVGASVRRIGLPILDRHTGPAFARETGVAALPSGAGAALLSRRTFVGGVEDGLPVVAARDAENADTPDDEYG